MSVAVITGGGGDVGAAVAARMSADGWTVVVADLDPAAAHRVAQRLPGVHARRLDVADPAGIGAFVASVTADFRRIDTLVCAAGIEPPQNLADIDVASWDRTQDVNLRGPALLAQAVLPQWAERRSGSMVNIGSRTWLGGGHPGYAASKAGLVGLTRSLAMELAPLGVRVNAVAPSFVRTGFSRQRGDERMLDDYAERVRAVTPMRELVRTEDVANAVAFLAGDQAARITGEVLHVCAGSQLPMFL
ncbi:D-threitol dehydrogenase [Microtetraspora sp. NBRC 13810]|uniref:SDR family NAD(P)-dependent oxidoreductase n=1 Tax=Microtetraspora sp. NBRC 13810 TaxID=3030990 RepID=UPI0024A3F10B|nr:SDR family oxidoreductase [Microtetraspora sp. NBRC 13810]GLW11254.1 D-threitol dehydrogenase [Microtetraspora sp. NBRC 13810]